MVPLRGLEIKKEQISNFTYGLLTVTKINSGSVYNLCNINAFK
jgi:hypothetical protein